MRYISAPSTAIKAAGNGKIEGILIPFTGPDRVDNYGDYFDTKSKIDLEDGDELPLLWHHGRDPEIGEKPIGKGTVKRVSAGWWFQSWLDMRDEYERYMYKLAVMGKLGYSSGADPSTVARRPIKKGINHITRWDVLEGSLTPVPAFFGNSVSIKSLMLKAGARHSATDAADLQSIHDLSVRQGAVCGAAKSDRRRRLELELDLLQIEADYTRELELRARALRLTETPAEQKARLLRDLDRLQRSLTR